MITELLFSDLQNLYGDYYNAEYINKCLPDGKLVKTLSTQTPYFAENTPSVICLGAMTESNQLRAIKALMPYRDRLKELIEGGTVIIATGNSFEIFGSCIDDGDVHIPCLGIFDYKIKRDMNNRKNCFFLGEFNDIKIVGHKGQFSDCTDFGDMGFINVSGGFGLSRESTKEGVHYKNFFGTYLMGPFLILNPLFVKYLLLILGIKSELAFEDEIMSAYRTRLMRLEEPDTHFLMGAE